MKTLFLLSIAVMFFQKVGFCETEPVIVPDYWISCEHSLISPLSIEAPKMVNLDGTVQNLTVKNPEQLSALECLNHHRYTFLCPHGHLRTEYDRNGILSIYQRDGRTSYRKILKISENSVDLFPPQAFPEQNFFVIRNKDFFEYRDLANAEVLSYLPVPKTIRVDGTIERVQEVRIAPDGFSLDVITGNGVRIVDGKTHQVIFQGDDYDEIHRTKNPFLFLVSSQNQNPLDQLETILEGAVLFDISQQHPIKKRHLPPIDREIDDEAANLFYAIGGDWNLSIDGNYLIASIELLREDPIGVGATQSAAEILVWNIDKEKEQFQATLTGTTPLSKFVAYAKKDLFITTPTVGDEIYVFRLSTGERMGSLKGHLGRRLHILEMALDEENGILTTLGEDQQLIQWDLNQIHTE